MIWWIVILVLLLIILLLPLTLKVVVSFDLAENKGLLSLRFFKIILLKDKFKLGYNSITFESKNKITTTKFRDFGKSSFGDRFAFSVVDVMKVNALKSDIVVGLQDNSFAPNIIAGFVLIIESALLAIISTKKQISVLRAAALSTNLESNIWVKFSLSISINILQVIFCLIKALFVIKKGVNKYGKQSS